MVMSVCVIVSVSLVHSSVNVGACLCKSVCQSLCQVGQASQWSVFLFVFVSPSIHSCKFKIFKKIFCFFFVFGVC